jgi:hypothetical protein
MDLASVMVGFGLDFCWKSFFALWGRILSFPMTDEIRHLQILEVIFHILVEGFEESKLKS